MSAPAAAPTRRRPPAAGTRAPVRPPARPARPTRPARPAPPRTSARRPPAPARVAVGRRGRRVRTTALFVVAVGILLTVVASHTVLAQNQVRLDRLEERIAAEERRYDGLRLANGRLSSPARITARAAELGLTVPVVPPVAVAVVGEVPRRGSTGSNLSGWAEVKGHLAAAP